MLRIDSGGASVLLRYLKKSNLHYTHGITPKNATSSGAHIRCLAPGLYSFEGRNDGEPLVRLCQFDRPRNQTPDLMH